MFLSDCAILHPHQQCMRLPGTRANDTETLNGQMV